MHVVRLVATFNLPLAALDHQSVYQLQFRTGAALPISLYMTERDGLTWGLGVHRLLQNNLFWSRVHLGGNFL